MANCYPNNQDPCMIVPRSHFYPHRFLVPAPVPVPIPVPFPVPAAYLIRMEEQTTKSLVQFMANEGLLPTPDDDDKRKDAILKLKQIVMAWITKVAWQRQLPKPEIVNASATILTYGSYGLGAHGMDSDIDALCVGPYFATIAEDFFIVLRNMLLSIPEVSDLHCVKDAKVPLMRFKFNGISIDLPYAQLRVSSVPDDIDVLDGFFLQGIDESSWKSLSGVRANMRVLQLVPNVEKFQSVLRCLKLWAKRRGVYCNLVGFFGGIHIVVLTAYVCQRHPNASISFLISTFFETFAFWPWPTPVVLEEGSLPMGGEFAETRSPMPIQLPCTRDQYCHSNITKSTFQRIREEFLRGYTITREILKPDFEWNILFDPFPYSKKYRRFVRILLAASNQDELGNWVGWVKSRFRSLLLKLEGVQGLCDPNPTEYVDPDVQLPNTVFYWGLQPGRTNFRDARFVEEFFVNHTSNGYQGVIGTLKLSVVDSSQLPKSAQFDESRSQSTSKGYWRMIDHNGQRIPVYSYYLPNYVVGYMARSGEYPSAGG